MTFDNYCNCPKDCQYLRVNPNNIYDQTCEVEPRFYIRLSLDDNDMPIAECKEEDFGVIIDDN